MNLNIHPSVGVARLGNSPSSFCLSPNEIGGLPFEADAFGNSLGPISTFKDDLGRVKRQGQPFRIYNNAGEELTLKSANVASITWTVHLANKKAAWYQYSELDGNLLYGPENSYTKRGVAFKNNKVIGEDARRKLIIDPGPRTLSGTRQSIGFDASCVPKNYPASYPSSKVKHGLPVTTLGSLVTDDYGRLVVLGAHGNAGGNEPLINYGGSDTWHDDIADGPVYCTVSFTDSSPDIHLEAWVIIGSPDFAPEIVNISNLSDSMFDVAVRNFDIAPQLFSGGSYNTTFVANYQRDILPIIKRFGRYQWVANVQSMMAFSSNIFDFSDPSEFNKTNRQNYFAYFRQPNNKSNPSPDQPQETLMRTKGSDSFPMMPLNSGSNSVSNDNIVKFLALNDTQQFLLQQWADGKFTNDPLYDTFGIDAKDTASVGNCVGLPMCPGIEVTWSVQNPKIYASPYHIWHSKGQGGYDSTGLTPSRDECEGEGCEPGDLTKRMACPWQADFFQCTIQTVNFTDPTINKKDKTPMPPTYFAYWWPPQSPWDVITGEFTEEGQAQNYLPAGQQMNYARGINSFNQMVEHWSALAFIRDRNANDQGFPFFTEVERTNDLFSFKEVPVGDITHNSKDNETTIPVFFIKETSEILANKELKSAKLVESLEERAFKKIEIAEEGLGKPRSGTRLRR